MFAGHLGVALMATRVEPRINPGWFAAAALGLDGLLWLFILLGWESVSIPADFAAHHQPVFDFPYSHGLLAALGWSALAAALFRGAAQRIGGHAPRAAALGAGLVFSHWLLDWLVHRPELPLAGATAPHVGLALWDVMPVALLVEALLMLAGLHIGLRALAGASVPRSRCRALALFGLAVLAFTVVGMTLAPPPPSATAMAATSLATLLAVCLLVGWLARPARSPGVASA